jgi:hypothetical protein
MERLPDIANIELFTTIANTETAPAAVAITEPELHEEFLSPIVVNMKVVGSQDKKAPQFILEASNYDEDSRQDVTARVTPDKIANTAPDTLESCEESPSVHFALVIANTGVINPHNPTAPPSIHKSPSHHEVSGPNEAEVVAPVAHVANTPLSREESLTLQLSPTIASTETMYPLDASPKPSVQKN